MAETALETYVTQIADDAERIFGSRLNRALLEAYAREVLLDLWLTTPGVTVRMAELALDRVLAEFTRRFAQANGTAAGKRAWGWCAASR